MTASGVAALAKVTRDRELALTALVARAVERERARVSPSDALAMERRVVKARFRGSSVAYRAAVAEAGASLAVARGILGDELPLRRDRRPDGSSRASRRETCPVSARRSRPCSRGRSRSRPPRAGCRTGRASCLRRPRRRRSSRSVAGGAPRFARPRARSSSRHAVRRPRSAHSRPSSPAPPSRASCGRSAAPRRTPRGRFGCRRRQRASSCASGIGLPELGVVSLSAFAPFLSLHEAEAARWFAARSGS